MSGQGGSAGLCGVDWCNGSRGSALALFLLSQSTADSTGLHPCSASGPLPRPLWKGFGVVLVLPLTLALTATALHLKTSCPLPSCGKLRKLPLALTPGKNNQ